MSKITDSDADEREQSLGDLFVSITGTTEVTEGGVDHADRRIPTQEELAVSEYVAGPSSVDGLGDSLEPHGDADLDW